MKFWTAGLFCVALGFVAVGRAPGDADARPQAVPSPAPSETATQAAPAPSPAESATPIPAPTLAPAATPTQSPSPSPSPSPTPRRHGFFDYRPKATPTPSPSPTPVPTATPSPAPSPTPSPTATPTATPSPSAAPNTATIPQMLDDPDVLRATRGSIPQIRDLAWLTGTWNAKGTRYIGAGATRPMPSNAYVFATTLGSRWIFGADGRSTDFMYITYDPFADRFALTRMQASPAYGLWTSPTGWRQNRIVFTSEAAYAIGLPYKRRFTIERTGARACRFTDEEQLADGSWNLDAVLTLIKVR